MILNRHFADDLSPLRSLVTNGSVLPTWRRPRRSEHYQERDSGAVPFSAAKFPTLRPAHVFSDNVDAAIVSMSNIMPVATDRASQWRTDFCRKDSKPT